MKLHQNKELFTDAVVETSRWMGLGEIFIEKDYWVTYALKTLFSSDVSEEIVFKGGTSLSKCYGMIERFSEDIDLVVSTSKSDSDNSIKRKIRNVGKELSRHLPEIDIPGVTNKKGRIRKTAHSYSKTREGESGQVSDRIILEVSSLGRATPNRDFNISSYIAQMITDRGMSDIIEKYSLKPFQVHVLSKERTFCEKIMGLVRFSFSEDPIAML